MLLTVAACSSGADPDGEATPATSATVVAADAGSGVDDSPPGSIAPPVRPAGFRSVSARVVPADGGDPCELCVWLADRDDLRRRGLMEVTDLGAADAMVFVFDEPRTTAFTMRNTLLPLSIAFFGVDGTFLDAFDMTPCAAEPCDAYPTPRDVTVAIEVPQGSLGAFGIGPGAVIELLDADCPPRSDDG